MRPIGSIITHRFVREGLLISFIVSFLIGLQALLTPRIHDIRYIYGNKTEQVSTAQVSIPVRPKQQVMEGWATVDLQPWQSTILSVSGDDCVSELEINGRIVTEIPPCSIRLSGKHYDFESYLQTGSNAIHITINDQRGVRIGFSIEVSQRSLSMKILNLITMMLVTMWIFTLASRTFLKHQPGMQVLLGAGFLLRALYVSGPSSMARTYDTDSHIDYIQYMIQHWSVPPAALGWELHQGPLYYFLMAIIMKISYLLGYGNQTSISWIMYASFLLSCLTLGAAAWCALLLFPEENRRKSMLVFFSLVTFFPGLFFFTSRINNDVLFQLLSFIFLGCLLTWWKNGKTSWLVTASVVVGLGFITKANAFLFAPILLICIVFRTSTPMKLRYRWILLAAGVILTIAGWYLAIRYFENDFVRLMAPGNGMHPGLAVSNTVSNYLTFNPFDIVYQPYANAWDESTGRQYFWVFLFKTSLFGEFLYPKNLLLVSRILSVLFMGALAMAALGIGRSIKKNDMYLIPLLVCLIIILEGAFGYRWLHPAASNQDFRYSLLLLPLLSYFAVRATEILGKVGMFLRAWLLAFSVCCLWFLFFLSTQA